MTSGELWQIYVRKNPALLAGTVIFTREGIRKFFDTTFAAALEKGEHATPPPSSIPDFMRPFLGGKR